MVGGVPTPQIGHMEHFPPGPRDTLVMLAPLRDTVVPLPVVPVHTEVVCARPETYVFENYFAVNDSKPASPCFPSHSCSLDIIHRDQLGLKPTTHSTGNLASEFRVLSSTVMTVGHIVQELEKERFGLAQHTCAAFKALTRVWQPLHSFLKGKAMRPACKKIIMTPRTITGDIARELGELRSALGSGVQLETHQRILQPIQTDAPNNYFTADNRWGHCEKIGRAVIGVGKWGAT